MIFSLVHELRGLQSETDGRMRIRANGALPGSVAAEFETKLNKLDGIRATANARTGSFLVLYENAAARESALTLLLDEAEKPHHCMSMKKQDVAGSLFPLFRYLFIRPFLPPVLRVGLAFLGAVPYLVKGVSELLHGRLSVEVLDASAITASLVMRDFRTVSMLTLLLGLGDTLAMWTKQHSLASLTESLTLNVRTVWRRENGKEVSVPLSKVRAGDLVIIRAGSSIPVDGVVEEGLAVVNQSSMTGEPIGVKREAGGAIFAGTVVEEGEIVVRVTKVGDQTRFRQVAAFIEESEALKAGIQGEGASGLPTWLSPLPSVLPHLSTL